MSAVEATKLEIEGYPESVRNSALAATALTLADRLTDAGSRDVAPIARELRAALTELKDRASATPKEATDFDRIRARRSGKCPTCGATAPKRSARNK